MSLNIYLYKITDGIFRGVLVVSGLVSSGAIAKLDESVLQMF